MRCNGLSVKVEADGAVEVGAEGVDVGGFELLQHFLAGMAVAIAEPAGDDGPLGGDAGKKCRTGGSDAAVMADFEQSALQTGFGEHGIFDGRFGISLEHDRGCAVGHVENKRIVVGGRRTGLVAGERREDSDLGCAEGERVAGAEGADTDMEASGFVEQRVVRPVAGIVADP